MQTPTWRSICAMLCLLLLLSALFPVKAAAETVPAKVVRVGSFEDTFNYVNEKGICTAYLHGRFLRGKAEESCRQKELMEVEPDE